MFKPFDWSLFWRKNRFWHEANSMRQGQALMWALRDIDSAIYSKIVNSAADCFYDDSKIPAFFEALQHELGDQNV